MPAMLPATLLFRGAVYKLAQPPATEHHEHEHPTHISVPVPSAQPYNPAGHLKAFGFAAHYHGLGNASAQDAISHLQRFQPDMTTTQHRTHRAYHAQQAKYFAREADALESMIRSNPTGIVKPHLKGLRRAQQSFRELARHHGAFFQAHDHLMNQSSPPPPAPTINYFGTD